MAQTVIMERQTLVFQYEEEGGVYVSAITPALFVPETGADYQVLWGEETWLCSVFTKMDDEETVHLGNPSLEGGEDNGIPFLMIFAKDGSYMIIGTTESGETREVGVWMLEEDAQVPSATVKIKGYSGAEHTYENVPKVWLAAPESTADTPVLVPFTYGEALDNVEVAPDFSAGDQKVTMPDGYMARSAVVKRPAELVPGNIRAGVSVAGITGDYDGEAPETEEKTVEADFSGGNMVLVPTAGKYLAKATVTKPETLIPENIAEGVDIAGIVGTSSGGVDISQIAECTLTEVISENIGTVAQYAFYGMNQLKKVDAPNLTDVQNNGFYNCTNLKEVKAPKLSSIGNYAFQGCSLLEEIDVRNVNTVGTGAFAECKALTVLDFGTSINSKIGTRAFSTGGPVGVIIRNTTMIPDASSAASGYIFGSTTQRLYVPRSMVSTWKASNYMKQYHASIVVAIEDYPDICG